MEELEIKGLREKLNVTDEEFENLANLRIATQMQTATMMINVMRRGGNIHGVNEKATARRRGANRAARAQRKLQKSW